MASISWPLAHRAQPLSDITTVTGSLGTRSFSVNAFDSARSTNLERRSSPYSSAAAKISFFISVLIRILELRIFSKYSCSSRSSSCSARILNSSNLASCLSFISKMEWA